MFFGEFHSCYAASMLPRQARGTVRKVFTKPAKQPDGGQCIFDHFVNGFGHIFSIYVLKFENHLLGGPSGHR